MCRWNSHSGERPGTIARVTNGARDLSSQEIKDREALLRPRPNVMVKSSAGLVASCLWSYGEDDLAERARGMSEADLGSIEAIASHFERPSYPLPMTDQRITHGHVLAFAAIYFFEGRLRQLSRNRRRSSRELPARFTASQNN